MLFLKHVLIRLWRLWLEKYFIGKLLGILLLIILLLLLFFYVILMHTFGLFLFVFIFTWLEGLFLKKLLNGKKKRKFGEKN